MKKISFDLKKPNPQDYGIEETEIEELKSQYNTFEKEKNTIPLSWNILFGLSEFLCIFSVPGLIFTGLALISRENEYLRLVPILLLVFLTPVVLYKIMDKVIENKKRKYSFNRIDEYNNLKKYEKELMKYEYYHKDITEYEKRNIDTLIKQSENRIDYNEAEIFVRITRLHLLFGKDEVLTQFKLFAESLKEKYGLAKSVFRLSFFVSELETNRIISSEEAKTLNSEYTHILEKEIIKN